MRRFFLLALALVLTTALFASTIELNTIFGPEDLSYYIERNQKFYDQTGVRVNITVVPYGRDQNIKLMASMLAGGSQYDIFIIDCVEVPMYVESGWVLPVDEWLTEDLKADAVPFALSGMAYQGHWYGLPWVSEWKSFVYNRELIKKVGYTEFPKTWNEVVELSKKLQEAGLVKYATAWSWAQKESLICDFVAILASFGGKFFDDNLNPVFNDAKGVQAVQFMVDMIYKHQIVNPASLGWTETEVYKAIYNKDIAFGMMWGLPLIDLDNPEISKGPGEWEIGLMPSVDGEHPYSVSGPMGWAISYGTKNPKEAFEYIKFLAGPQGSLDASLKAGIVPGWKSVWENPEFQKKVRGLDKMYEQAMYIVHRPQVPWYLEFSSVLQEELHNALTRKKTPQAALNDAAKAAIRIRDEWQQKKK
ncbi:MAG: extracellular solute-binding protein [Pseudothermotoga sp.]